MKKFVCQFFNKNCLETGLKPDIPTINAAALEYVKRFPLFNVPAVAFSDSDFDETISAYLPYPIVKVVPLGRTPVESKKIFPSIEDCIRLLNAYVIAAAGPLVHFSSTSLDHHGPFDYQRWTAHGFPKNLAPFNTPKGFQKDARKSLKQLNQCCNSFLKSFLHFHHNNG